MVAINTNYKNDISNIKSIEEQLKNIADLGFCFDSGHGTLVGSDDHLIFAKRYKDRIIALHLQDTDSIAPELINDKILKTIISSER